MNKKELIAQENQIKDHWEAGDIVSLCHLMGGNEDQLIEIFKEINPEDFVFASHRCHYHYSLHGGKDLVQKVLDGQSMFLYGSNFICSAIVGGTLSMACGMALSFKLKGSPRKVWAFCGDGATDQGAFWEAIRFAECRNLPITFIVEDNGGQCGVNWETRWGCPAPESNNGRYGLEWDLSKYWCVIYYRYTPVHPHAGCVGLDGKPTRPPIKWIERKFEKPV